MPRYSFGMQQTPEVLRVTYRREEQTPSGLIRLTDLGASVKERPVSGSRSGSGLYLPSHLLHGPAIGAGPAQAYEESGGSFVDMSDFRHAGARTVLGMVGTAGGFRPAPEFPMAEDTPVLVADLTEREVIVGIHRVLCGAPLPPADEQDLSTGMYL